MAGITRLDASVLTGSPALAEAVLAHASDLVLLFARDGTITWASPAAERLFGHRPDDLVGRSGFDLIHPEDRDLAMLASLAMPGLGDQQRIELRVLDADGRERWVEEVATNLLDDPAVGVVVAHVHDVTERVERRRAAEADRQRLADAQALAHLGSFEINLATGQVRRSDELCRILGYAPHELGPDVNLDPVHPDDREAVAAGLAAAAEGAADVALTHRIVRRDGEVRWVVSRTSPAPAGRPHVVAGTVLDVTERYEAERALAHQATHDPLTGLANRRLFVQRLEEELARGARTAVLFVDLDDFKAVNDRIGHVDGDQVIRTVAHRVAAAVPEATVGRLGGDELVICCGGTLGAEHARALARRVEQAMAEPVRVGDHEHLVTASIGVALSGPDSRAEALLRNADMAMYAAKEAGGARTELFDDALHERSRRRSLLAAELAAALARGDVEVRFQPEVHLADGGIAGFEALARWTHPVRGPIPPDEFVPLAEESGAIHALGRHVLEEACRRLADWRAAGHELGLGVAVNVSPVQLADPTFPDDVRAAIAAAGVPAEQICLEVTESTLMDVDVAQQALRSLTRIGVTIAIDDFGTGYSSLSRLKHLPVTFLKVDRSFVAGLGLDHDDEAIVASVVGLARSLGLRVIAEGVETAAQRAALAALGCELGQGYLWSRPVDAEHAASLLA